MDGGPCPDAADDVGAPTSAPSTADVFAATGNPYDTGALAIRTLDIARCERGAPVPLRIHAPESPGEYAVVVFQHGFMSRNDYYDDILSLLASHGFVVVVPQMYEQGLGVLTGNPNATAEAELAGKVIDWLPGHLNEITGVNARTDHLGIAGHSRGGMVSWMVASRDPSRIGAIAGIDPVDGAAGPAGGRALPAQGTLSFALPSLVIGAELGGNCAPASGNHVKFYAACQSPAWHVIALGQGHGDMLDEPEAAAAAAFCGSGSDNRPGMRRLTAGLLAAFFRAALQGDASGYDQLSTPPADGVAISFESK